MHIRGFHRGTNVRASGASRTVNAPQATDANRGTQCCVPADRIARAGLGAVNVRLYEATHTTSHVVVGVC